MRKRVEVGGREEGRRKVSDASKKRTGSRVRVSGWERVGRNTSTNLEHVALRLVGSHEFSKDRKLV